MWSEPFIRLGANGTKLAVYVVDTQGLFDNETTQSLTASRNEARYLARPTMM